MRISQRTLAISVLFLTSWVILACGAGQLSTPTIAPTDSPTLANSPTPSLTHTPRPTSTDAPTPTITPLPAWVTEFGQPILDAIADRPPDYQDDFSQASPDWQREMFNCRDNRCVISDGVLMLTQGPEDKDTWIVMTIPYYLTFKTFVMSVDVNTSDLSGANEAGIGYDNEGVKFSVFILDNRLELSLARDSGKILLPIPDIITLTIIVRDTKIAMYMNDIPVTARDFTPVMNRYGLTLRSWSDGTTTTTVEYDNLKIWVLDKVPNIP